jgi:V/A-type H+-transporting ATPase subunit D
MELKDIELSTENIVGVELPQLESVEFQKKDALTLGQPFWTPILLKRVAEHLELLVARDVLRKRVEQVEYAVRKVTQRVNLFEKVLIPEAQKQIRRIQIHLADMERAAVVRSKFVKSRRQRMMETSS